jgi:hypothetical protein
MVQIVLDPKLLETVEYNIWKDGDKWVCLASRLPFVDEISGHGEDPKDALQDCRSQILAFFESFNS